jgi:hypothetical protein
MSNKCCSGPIQDEIIISGSGFRTRIQKNQDYCAVIKIPANQVFYIASEEKINEISNEISSNSSTSNTSNNCTTTNNSGLIISIVVLTILLILFIVLFIWSLARKSRKS